MSVKRTYARIARLYDLLDQPFEKLRYRPLRPLVFEGVRGRVLDAGVGTGHNMPFYPPDAEVTGLDLSPEMLARAEARRRELGIEVELREGDIRATGFPDDHFDFIVATFVFCVLPEEAQLPALRELARILKPTGEIRLLEYGFSKRPLRRFLMRLWVPWVRYAYGASFERRPESHAAAAGLEVAETRFVYEDIIRLVILRPAGDG